MGRKEEIELIEADGGSILLQVEFDKAKKIRSVTIPIAPHPNRLLRLWRFFLTLFFLPPPPDRVFDFDRELDNGVLICIERKDMTR